VLNILALNIKKKFIGTMNKKEGVNITTATKPGAR